MKVYCKDCKYIIKPTGALYEPHPESICSRVYKMNYVIGQRDSKLCKIYNKKGCCILYEEKGIFSES